MRPELTGECGTEEQTKVYSTLGLRPDHCGCPSRLVENLVLFVTGKFLVFLQFILSLVIRRKVVYSSKYKLLKLTVLERTSK